MSNLGDNTHYLPAQVPPQISAALARPAGSGLQIIRNLPIPDGVIDVLALVPQGTIDKHRDLRIWLYVLTHIEAAPPASRRIIPLPREIAAISAKQSIIVNNADGIDSLGAFRAVTGIGAALAGVWLWHQRQVLPTAAAAAAAGTIGLAWINAEPRPHVDRKSVV